MSSTGTAATRLKTALALILLLAACGCGTHATSKNEPQWKGAELPAFAELPLSPRTAASVRTRNGADFLLSGGAAAAQDNQLELNPAAGELAFAVYSFLLPADVTVNSVTVNSSTAPAEPLWIALSDFSTQRWSLSPLASGGATLTVERSAGELSNSSHLVYVGVLAYGAALSVQSVSLDHNGDALSWTHSWGTSVPEDGRYVDMDSAGNLYCAVDSTEDSQKVSPILLKYDHDGSLLAASKWTDPELFGSSLGLRELLAGPDGEVYACYSAGTSRKTFILKADADLNLLWCRRVDHATKQDSIGSLGFDAEGNLVAYVYVDDQPNNDGYGMLLWLAPDGTLIRQLKLTFSVIAERPLYRRMVVEPTSGDLLFSGVRNVYSSNSAGTLALLRTDSTGNLIFSRYVSTSLAINTTSSENGVDFDAAGNMVAISDCPKAQIGDPSIGVLLTRVDASGGLISIQKLLTPQETALLRPRRMCERSSSGDILIQAYGNAGAGNITVLLQLSPLDASPLGWTSFGYQVFHSIDQAGSYFLIGNFDGGVLPALTPLSGSDVTVVDLSADVGLSDPGDTLTAIDEEFLSDETGTQLEAITGAEDFLEAGSSEALIARRIP